MSPEVSSLSPPWMRFFYNVGRLWPELTALALYIAHLWMPFIRAWGNAHPAIRGFAVVFFVLLAHQQTPLGRER